MRDSRLGLPYRPFLYTLDQIADMLQVPYKDIPKYLFFEGANTGLRPKDRLCCLNIAPTMEEPEWRVEEIELLRFLKEKRITLLTR